MRGKELAFAVLLSTGALAQSVQAQEQPDPDAQIAYQLQGAQGGDELTLANPKISYVASLPWIGGRADLAFIASEDGQFLATVTAADCIRQALHDQNQLKGTFTPGIYHPDQRFDSVTASVTTGEIFPTPPIIRAEKITKDGRDSDCAETGAVEDIESLAKRINDSLPSASEDGARSVGNVARAILRGLRESR